MTMFNVKIDLTAVIIVEVVKKSLQIRHFITL